jgi:hypothetical protein
MWSVEVAGRAVAADELGPRHEDDADGSSHAEFGLL